MLQRAASNAYSWWWASHIRTRQSKWLDSNLQDMDDRVKCILLLLGEEADSFAKRAEMYYQRRPEVISSVEEAYRAYRALAERYDHMSGELHKANHTVATAFPDQVQYSMLEEDDDSLPKAFTTVDPRKIRKSTVEGLMKKKKGDKSGPKGGGANSAGPVNKDNAQSEISRKQKEILVLQTEKEFIKSSYESGIAKYWDLEKQINDMHEEVCYFQEEFSESAVIEDDEARALMTASALKSCEDTISKLQEQQKLSFSQAMVELERANVSRDKLKNIMKKHGKVLSDSGNSLYENAANDASVEMDDVYSMKQQKIEMEAIVDKIKEYFQKDTDISVAEIAEKIDDIVNKVVDLELMVSSQTAKIDRLCLENTDLEKSLHELEEVKAVVTSGSGELNEKLEKAEDELMRVQYLESSFHEEESIVYSNFAETVTSFCGITDMLQSPLIEHQTDPVLTQADEATPSNHTEPFGEYDKQDSKHAIDGFPDWSRELELEIFSGNKQPSDGYHESMAEKHYRADDLEDLWHCGLESKSSLTAPPVSKEISDEDASGEHNNKEVEYVHGTVGNLGSSMQPYVVHSCEQGSLDQLHNISTDAPQDHDLKQVDDKQDLSTAGHSISAGHSEKEMNKAEESENTRSTENSTPCNGKVVGAVDQEENMANLQELLMSGLQDKEKVLLTEYTSILRNYKNAKRSLTEMEIKNEECLNEMKAMMSELRCANELKDKEIRSLRELLNSSTDKDAQHSGHHINTNTTVSFKSGSFRGHRRIPSFLPVHQRRQSASSIQNYSPKNNANHEAHMEDDASHDTVLDQESIVLGDHRLTNILEMENASPLEDKFRRDIDGLLGENLEFWMKFSTSFQKIQEFQTKHDQLQSEIGKIVNEDKLKVNSGRASDPPAKVESEAIEKQLRELKIDMQVWLEQNAMFKGELHYRFSSLCSIQEEIQAAMEMDAETEEGIQFTSYHAAKFQGEILNMKQENNKVADELQAGLDHIRGLQGEIEKVIPKILNSPSLSASKGFGTWRNTPSKSRVPLRSFLFPAKKKKSSLLACMNPALQKQHSDMAFFAKME
ncbi:protein NETWORKED 2A-like [Lolium perenne]|uniref:protein NETWORKED 2A-like n=1 Tax=Lolium perenne TaxID=4522 RepID=UPI003A99E1CC